jgi:hypothetical protein
VKNVRDRVAVARLRIEFASEAPNFLADVALGALTIHAARSRLV